MEETIENQVDEKKQNQETIVPEKEFETEVEIELNDFPISVTKNIADETEKPKSIVEQIKEKLEIPDRLILKRKRLALIAVATSMFFTSACTKIGANLEDPFSRNDPNVEEVNRMDTKGLSQTEQKESSLEEIFERATKYWPHTRLEDGKQYLIEEAEKYSTMYPQYSKELLLAVFTSVSMTESNGGIFLDSNVGGDPNMSAKGWFQVIPYWHLNDFNLLNSKNYTSEDLLNDDKKSIEIGVWALMRYAPSYDLADCLKIFKSGTDISSFGQWSDDGIWWNRVSYSIEKLLGKDVLNMGYTDYSLESGVFSANNFLQVPEHIGNVYVGK